jgi:Ulp1 family protease
MVDFKDTDLVLNYNDAVIYGSDLALVQSRSAWLNDACINFFFELTKQRVGKSIPVTFMDPSVVSFFVHQCIEEDEIKEFVDGASFPVTGKMFIPVNDSMVQSTAWHTRGGSHWSLLLVAKSNKEVQFWHFDSVGNSGNMKAAEEIAGKLGTNCFDISSPTVVQAITPPQTNGYDCGIHMLAAVQIFAPMEEMDLITHEAGLRREIHDSPGFCIDLRRGMTNEILRLHDDDSLT